MYPVSYTLALLGNHMVQWMIWFELLVLSLTPLSAIFQLYHGDQF